MTAPAPKAVGNAAEGLIRFFTSHRTAHNLLMALIILAGLAAMSQLRRQFFPDVNIPVISVNIAYPGATAIQVDAGLVAPLEPTLRQIANVREVQARSGNGFASFQLEFPVSTDLDAKLGEVQRAVASVALPTDASDPDISQVAFEDTVTHFVLSGPVRHEVLAAYGRDLQDLIEARVDATVKLFGAPLPERRVELDPAKLEAANLSVLEVSNLVSAQVREVSAGSLASTSLSLQAGETPEAARDIERLPLVTRPDGSTVRVSDVGQVFVASDPDTTFLLYIGDRPAVDLDIVRSESGDSLKIHRIATEVKEDFEKSLPDNIKITEWGNSAELIQSRINLLISNGGWGLLIVLGLLFIFMGARSAFWVAAGIPVAILGTLAVMLGLGQTINMISMFAILLSLGIIVDDAIVVAEHADALHRKGLRAQEAAMRGGIRMSGPVLASSLTTVGAFAPLFVVSGEFGSFIIAFPLVVIAVIIASLLECFLVLPGHMKSALMAREADGDTAARWNILAWFRHYFDLGFAYFRDHIFTPLVRAAVAYRYVTLTFGFLTMLSAYVLLLFGDIEQQFSPDVEFNNIFGAFEMSSTSDLEDTVAFCGELNRSLTEALETLGAADDLIIGACYTGLNFLDPESIATDQSAQTIATLITEFTDADKRGFTNDELLTAWRPIINRPANLKSLELGEPAVGPAEQAIRLRLEGQDLDKLATAANELMQRVAAIDGVSDVATSFSLGAETLTYRTSDFGRALGFSDETIGSQMRAALTGSTAYRFLENEREIPVRFVLSEEAQTGGFQETYRLKSPSGTYATITDIADQSLGRGLDEIRRYNGQIVVTVSGDLNQSQTSLFEFQQQIETPEIADMLAVYGAKLSVGGEAEQQQAFFDDLTLGAYIGLATIFIVLAWVFSSYTRPFVVMAVIPFGIVGAVYGHWALDMSMSLLSYISIFGLSGIVVNDSIVLVSRIDERAEKGEGIYTAIVGAAGDRLRAVILTSLTTIGGLLPLMFETSLQAQFLIPMAVTVVFGLAFSTVLILVFVPAMIGVQADLGRMGRGLYALMFLAKKSPEPSTDARPFQP